MSRPIGPTKIADVALDFMRTRGGSWAVYQNMCLGDPGLGDLWFLRVGPGCTFETPPERMPDTPQSINWRYWYVGMVDVGRGEVMP